MRSPVQPPTQSRMGFLWHLPGNVAANDILEVVVII